MLALPLGLIEALASASLDALPPRLVDEEDLVTANALLGGAQDLAIVVGPVVAAVVNARWGLAGAFGADAVTYLFGLAVAVPLAVGRWAEPHHSRRGGRCGRGWISPAAPEACAGRLLSLPGPTCCGPCSACSSLSA
ncbi:MAG: hypothetical protein M3P34_01050 [Actinomycetota bacterium]|nr:hypothetical protein [Actinomycetota bacterium]